MKIENIDGGGMKKNLISKELKWALSYLKPYTWPLIGIFFLIFAQNYSFALLPKIGTNFFFELLSPEKIHLLVKYFGLAVVIIIAKSFFQFVRGYSVRIVLVSVLKKIRDKIFEHLLIMDTDFFSQNKKGNNDVSMIERGFYKGLLQFLSKIIMVIIIIVRLFLLNWQLTLISLGVIPVIFFIVKIIGKKMRLASKKIRKNIAELSINLHETLTGMEVVKAYTQEKYELRNF